MIGKTLAHYEITGLLGKGGMGEVYRALDKKLGRDVALKILPREFSGDPERAARFEREARSLASLQHPNIASIYGYEEVDGVRFLAMELVEGEDLSQQLQRGPLSIDEALRIARQIAIGLEAAHEKNIMHRDLKPANVKVDPDGVVKILDFGLARAFAGDSEDHPVQNSPTITSAQTMAGVIIGTAAYMSPEQARGKPTDKRSDIWAFGVMLYELLTGTQMYRGETVTDVLGAIVHSTPDLQALPKEVSPQLRLLIQRCLTPDAQDRLRDIGEARYALHHLDAASDLDAPAPGKSNRLWMVACGVMLAALLGVAGYLWLAPEAANPILQASITLPKDHLLLTTGPRGGSMRVSPDGGAIAFVAQSAGRRQIWVRTLDERVARPVPGTEGGHRPFWSPDGQSLGFFSEGKLRRISARGGAALTIANAQDGRGGAWFPDGTIVFAPTPGAAIFAVPAAGGEPRLLTGDPENSHREPRLLPDGRHFLFLENTEGGIWQIVVGSIEGDVRVVVGPTSGGVEYANGRLLFLQDRTLVAQPFDLGSYQLNGEPTPIAEDILRDNNFGIGVYSTSENGVLAFQAGGGAGSQLQWIDRGGNLVGVVGERSSYDAVSLSPDGKTIAALMDELDGQTDLWMINVDTSIRQRFTFTPDGVAIQRGDAVWSPDGSLLVYSYQGDGNTKIYRKQTDGSGKEELLIGMTNHDVWPYDFTPDGEHVLFGREDSTSNEDLCLVPVSGKGEPRALFETPFDEWPGRFSPDGRWLAFDSDETGRQEIYVIPYDGGTGKWQVSREGGRFARWKADGSEIYYLDLEGIMTAVPVDPAGESFVSGDPEELFQTDLGSGSVGEYDYDTIKERFLVLQQPAQEAPISLYVNWMTALEVR